MEKKYILIKDLGTAKAGDVYIRGLYEHPNKEMNYKVNDLYWRKGSALTDWNFFHKNTVIDTQYFKVVK